MTAPGPRGLTQQTAARTVAPSDLRTGIVVAVTSRGIDVAVGDGLVSGAAHISSYNPGVGDPVAMIQLQDAWLVLGRPVGPGTATDNATPGSGLGTTLLAGMALSGTGATMATSTGALVTVPRYGLSYFHPENHWVLLLCGVSHYSSVLNDTFWIALRNSNVLGTPQQVGVIDRVQAGTIGFGMFTTFGSMVSPAYGGKRADIYMDLQRSSGTGTSRVDDLAARRGFLLALDVGDGSVVATK